MSGDVNLQDEPVIFYSEEMTMAKMVVLKQKGIKLKLYTKVLKKIDSEAPHETFIILDATTGQSAINQVEEFNKIIPVTGLVMTKLDGTAKGGILLALSKKYKIPIIGLGLGEKEDDLQIFDVEKFAEAFTQIN